MTEKMKKKKSGAFAGGMLIYALVVIALILAAMRPFWQYIAAYEESGPNKAMDRYLESLDSEHIRAVSSDFLNGLDLGLQNGEQAFAAVEKSMSGTLRYTLKSSDVDLMHATYAIRNEQRELGQVTIGKEEDPPFGFSPWQVERESYDFSYLLGEDEITVPETWTVFCNGTLLDGSYLTGEKIPFDLLKDFYRDSRFRLPYRVTYKVDRIVGDAPFSLLDQNGQTVETPDALSEYEQLANCSETETAQIQTLLDGFLQRYINCLSNVNHDAHSNYYALKPYILGGSDIDRRVYDNIAGQYYAHSKGDTVEERTDHMFMNLDGGYYLADISYTLDTVGSRGHVKSVNNAWIIMQMTDDGLKVIEVYTY